MKTNIDLHLHTVVSDGEITPDDILSCAQELGLKEISITDHDAVGAYKNFKDDPVKKASQMGLTLIPGIEMDSYFSDVEIHVLGYGIDVNHPELTGYLDHIQGLRKKRIREEIVQVNRALKRDLLKEEEIIIPYRDTLMNPHLIHPILKTGIFKKYREAKVWVKEHTQSSVEVPKPSTGEMIELIKRAGGKAYLAHPGYYITEGGLDLDELIQALLPHGLEGLETEFPYYNTSPEFPTRESEAHLIHRLNEAARKYGLKTSRGSDSHTLEQMRAFNG
jgi:predicted metal-dependent phosphoesterase TrpH